MRRVAFLAPEFATENGATGGVGNYVLKMALALADRGIEAEVFVPSDQPGVVAYQGIRVERVARDRSVFRRGAARVLRPLAGPHAEVVIQLANARRLAAALRRRHGERPFQVVQSSNYHLTGASVERVPGRRHVVRISTSRRLYDDAFGGGRALTARAVETLDARIMRRADAAYAPSAFLADYFRRAYALDVRVVRPPAELGSEPARTLPFALPERYLVHFGSLSARKGTDIVARALATAWRDAPDLRMVWIGPIADAALAAYRAHWGDRADQVVALGTLDKALTYGAVQKAVAAILPSRVDNLPNTVIESLILGVPVIGSDGASIDELVEDGVSGALVPIGDDTALAAAMVAAWRGTARWLGDGFRTPTAIAEMRPDRAVQRFLDLIGSLDEGPR